MGCGRGKNRTLDMAEKEVIEFLQLDLPLKERNTRRSDTFGVCLTLKSGVSRKVYPVFISKDQINFIPRYILFFLSNKTGF